MDFDWKKTLPYIGAIATGNVPMLIAAATSAISEALGVPVPATQTGLEEAIKAATPEQLAAIKKVDAELKIRIAELQVESRKLDASVEIAYVEDVKSARQFNSNTHGILLLGYLINFASYACLFAVLFGCFWILGNSGRLAIDPGIAAMIGGVIGAAVQWLMQNASQANGFFFGSSPSSRQASTELSKAVGRAASNIS